MATALLSEYIRAVVCVMHRHPEVRATSTASWFETVGMCECVYARCVTEADGYHQHEYSYGEPGWFRVAVVDHLHNWMTSHLPAGTPFSSVFVLRGRTTTATHSVSLADVWATVPELAAHPIPAITCAASTVRVPDVPERVHVREERWPVG